MAALALGCGLSGVTMNALRLLIECLRDAEPMSRDTLYEETIIYFSVVCLLHLVTASMILLENQNSVAISVNSQIHDE